MRNVNSSLHEAGPGIYAQALQRLQLPATIAAPAGLGLDESQSRGFERIIGCSEAFWSFHFPRLAAASDGALAPADERAFVAALDAPHVDHLRIDSIGPAYDAHVLLRMRIERALLNGELRAADVRSAWNEAARELLGIEVPSDALGCMQDVHWSIGQWGYFPTYSLGNVYAAQLAERYRPELPGLDEELATTGSTRSLVAWLDEHVYAHGSGRTSKQIVEQATGRPLSIEPLARRYGA
jgi:carboxypeptidase Taq